MRIFVCPENILKEHLNFQRQTYIKGLCIEDDDEDAGFVPGKLFLFGIEEFQKVPQVRSLYKYMMFGKFIYKYNLISFIRRLNNDHFYFSFVWSLFQIKNIR